MINILEHAHKYYIPTQTTEEYIEDPDTKDQVTLKIDKFHYILYGGDQLTVEWMRGAQNVWANSCRGTEHLQGVQPVVEDWHSKVVLLKVYTQCTVELLFNRYCKTRIMKRRP